jgi:hypothetical protein
MSIACSSVSFSPAHHLDDRLPLPLVACKGRRVGRGHGDRQAGPAREPAWWEDAVARASTATA